MRIRRLPPPHPITFWLAAAMSSTTTLQALINAGYDMYVLRPHAHLCDLSADSSLCSQSIKVRGNTGVLPGFPQVAETIRDYSTTRPLQRRCYSLIIS